MYIDEDTKRTVLRTGLAIGAAVAVPYLLSQAPELPQIPSISNNLEYLVDMLSNFRSPINNLEQHIAHIGSIAAGSWMIASAYLGRAYLPSRNFITTIMGGAGSVGVVQAVNALSQLTDGKIPDFLQPFLEVVSNVKNNPDIGIVLPLAIGAAYAAAAYYIGKIVKEKVDDWLPYYFGMGLGKAAAILAVGVLAVAAFTVRPDYVTISTYDATRGGINCDSDCTFTATGERILTSNMPSGPYWWNGFSAGVACAPDKPPYSVFLGVAHGQPVMFTCIDRGGAVQGKIVDVLAHLDGQHAGNIREYKMPKTITGHTFGWLEKVYGVWIRK
jgi:hypothetical protein